MPSPIKAKEDRGLTEYATDAGGRWMVQLRIRGKLKQWRGFRTKTAARIHRDRIRTELHDRTFDPRQYQRRQAHALTISKLVALVEADYRRNRRSQRDANHLATFWRTAPYCEKPAALVTGNDILRWTDQLMASGLANATINRRMGFLLRGFRLAVDAQPPQLHTIPKWTPLEEAAPRSGFVEPLAYQQLRRALPGHAQIPVIIGYWTGMRYGEIRALSWPQITFDHRDKNVTLLLAGQQTKSGKPRMVVMGGDLYESLMVWHEETKARLPLCRWVCHRQGRQLGTIDTVWKSTCVTLGLATGHWNKSTGTWTEYDGLIFHDLRRSGVRNLVRAGVDRTTAMLISGHKTESVFNRYNIVNEQDLVDAGRKVVAYVEGKLAAV